MSLETPGVEEVVLDVSLLELIHVLVVRVFPFRFNNEKCYNTVILMTLNLLSKVKCFFTRGGGETKSFST